MHYVFVYETWLVVPVTVAQQLQ